MSTKEVIQKQMHRVGEALTENWMAVHYADTAAEVPALVRTLLTDGETVTTGGSESLKECGVMELLRSGAYNFLDRAACAPAEIPALYRAAFSADAYLCSANAVTENGELYNVDGNSNRVAAICFGPKKVILVVGCNKLVRTLDDAAKRVRMLAAPANCVRLDCKTYCKETGICAALSEENQAPGAGCHGADRICCNFVISAKQRIKDRIHVILVAESLGY